MVHIPFLIFSFSSLLTSKLQLYIPESITFLNCQCNVFWPCVAIIIAAAITKDCSYRNNCGFWLHAGDLEHCFMKEKSRSLYVFLLIFMFCYSRFRFRNLKDANSYMFSWCTWHDMTLKYLLFASTSYVQEGCKLNEANHG